MVPGGSVTGLLAIGATNMYSTRC
ncbi:hypothetical protein A2U01_0023883, partial [Trifolium medium]|nr:hypothetical protein [Trifolium medium]